MGQTRESGKRCYIAGPMHGYPAWNFPAFDAAEEALAGAGWDVISPARMDREEDGFDERTSGNLKPIDHYIERDVRLLMSLEPSRDVIVMLPGWERSKGATAERARALWRGLRIVTLEEACNDEG